MVRYDLSSEFVDGWDTAICHPPFLMEQVRLRAGNKRRYVRSNLSFRNWAQADRRA